MTIAIPPRRPDLRTQHRQSFIAQHAAQRPELADRAAAHCGAPTRRAQVWQCSVTDVETSVIMFAIEAGWRFHRGAITWRCAMPLPMPAPKVTAAIGELVRTGVLRDYRSPKTLERVLLPAPVHLAVGGLSACLFVGEDLGPMRARLTEDLGLVDCRECLALAANGS